jgi:hypothetical protein
MLKLPISELCSCRPVHFKGNGQDGKEGAADFTEDNIDI